MQHFLRSFTDRHHQSSTIRKSTLSGAVSIVTKPRRDQNLRLCLGNLKIYETLINFRDRVRARQYIFETTRLGPTTSRLGFGRSCTLTLVFFLFYQCIENMFSVLSFVIFSQGLVGLMQRYESHVVWELCIDIPLPPAKTFWGSG